MRRTPEERRAQLQRIDRALQGLYYWHPWRFRLLIVGMVLLFLALGAFFALVVHP